MHRLTGAIARVAFDKGRLHPHFDHAPARSIYCADSGPQTMRIAHQNHTESSHIKSRVAGWTLSIANLDERRRHAHCAAIERPAWSDCIKIRIGLIEQRTRRGVEFHLSITQEFLELD